MQKKKAILAGCKKIQKFVYPGLRYANKNQNLHAKFLFENVCLSTKIDLRLKKKHLGQF